MSEHIVEKPHLSQVLRDLKIAKQKTEENAKKVEPIEDMYLDIFLTDGSRGLSYSITEDGASCEGIGNSGITDSNIEIGSKVRGVPVVGIANNAFAGEMITGVIIGNNVTSIGDYAFNTCVPLRNITIGNSVKSIGEYAFVATPAASITIPDSVMNIGKYAFSDMPNLHRIVIGKGVTSIGDYAFYLTPCLEGFFVSEENLAYKSINGHLCTNDGKTLIKSAGSTVSLQIPEGIIYIYKYACEGRDHVQSVVIPNGVIDIGIGAFYNCSGLSSVTIPSSVTNIGEGAFYNTAITDVYYTGTEEEWNAIIIGASNDRITNATIHFESEV